MSILVILATFLAAAVEWVEALTIVLAVGTVRGWRAAFFGMTTAFLALAALVLVFGLSLTKYVPITTLRTLIGAFLLLFGLKWLYKAILRSSGLKSLHDESKAFAETSQHLRGAGGSGVRTLDWVGVGTSFNGVLLEGLEVVFIVIALGGLNSVPAAITGAVGSLVVVVAFGVAFRSPLTQVPENTMKYVVGIMLTAFGTFFVGEGIGVPWWRADLSLLPLIAVYGLASVLLVQVLKAPVRGAGTPSRATVILRAVWAEVWGLFVDDGALATFAVGTVLGVSLYLAHDHRGQFSGLLLTAGVLAAVGVGLAGAAREHRKVVRAEERQAAMAATPVTSRDGQLVEA